MDNREVTFKYIFEDDYNPRYINGAYGGIGPRGEIVANFYLERQPIPKEESYAIDQEGGVQQRLSQTPDDVNQKIVRYVETGVVFNYESAKRFHEWLGKHLENLEQMMESKDE